MNPTQQLLLPEHHHEIHAACEALRVSAFVDDPLDVIADFRRLERAVLEHMQAEEELVLPAYEDYSPADAAAIRATHAELRRQLYLLGIDAELHAIRLESIDCLIDTLREHAAHEDRELYPWAQTSLPPATTREVVERVSQSLRALALRNRPPESARPVHTPEVAE